MPSPFPGMDPYLEDPAGWPDVHHMLLGSIRELLREAASPQYLVRIEERDCEPEVHDFFLQIHDNRSHEVVAAIEVLSPANKVAGSRGHLAMIEKRDVLRRAGSHWVEIDLLRAGLRAPQIARRSDYCATVWPAHDANMYAWFANLRDGLPVIAVPVRRPDDDLPLDLQRALDLAYDRADYARLTDYDAPVPYPPLDPADQAWVERTLAGWREAESSV